MKFAQDLWRALLVLVVATILLERYCPPSVETMGAIGTMATPPAQQVAAPPYVQTQQVPLMYPASVPQVYIAPAQPERPLRRVAQSFLDLGDSMIGVIR
jgi:hypothetical protein